jgi:hypothetical protein
MPSIYRKTYNTFSGADIVATITLPGGTPVVLGELQTISYSIHRDKFPARTLGRINPKGFSYGGRTIAGSLIFTVFDKNVLKSVIEQAYHSQALGQMDLGSFTSAEQAYQINEMYYRMLADEMPPFDVTITFANEYGQMSSLAITGITIVDEGQVMSIEDMMTENTMAYQALDITPMLPVGQLTTAMEQDKPITKIIPYMPFNLTEEEKGK